MTTSFFGELATRKAQSSCKASKKPLALLRSLAKVHLRLQVKPIFLSPRIHVGLLLLGAATGWAWSLPSAAARPIAYAVCTPSNHTDRHCPPSYHLKGIIVIDRMSFDGISSFTTTYDYDPAKLIFRANETSLLCDLRSASATPYCPDFNPGIGTAPLTAFTDVFDVDQTGLSIITPSRAAVRLSYQAAAGTSVTGERNFLALAFDLVEHYDQGAIVTYNPAPILGDTLATGTLQCSDASGVSLPCDVANPASSLKLDPMPAQVPAPLALAGLPVMVHSTRRIRRRIRIAATR
jgi:hypothetical protein